MKRYHTKLELVITIFVLSVLCAVPIATSDGRFSVTPVSINATLNSTVQFHCELVSAGDIDWLINGTTLSDSSNAHRQASSYTAYSRVSTLTIKALKINDNITIQCIEFPSPRSAPAILRVQGLLNAPENVGVVDVTSSFIRLSWDAPETLDLTDTEPDIAYYLVSINDTLNGQKLVTSTDKTDYLFYPTGTSECTEYSFSVAAVNAVGIGSSSNSVPKSLSGPLLTFGRLEWQTVSTENSKGFISYNCTVDENMAITWKVFHNEDERALTGYILIRHYHNLTSKQYSEIIQVPTPELQDSAEVNVSIQCVGLRVCSRLLQAEHETQCVTSLCKSDVMLIPNFRIPVDNFTASISTATRGLTTQTFTSASTVEEFNKTELLQHKCIIRVGVSLGSVLVVLLLIQVFILIACCHKHIRQRQKTSLATATYFKNERVYESIVNIPQRAAEDMNPPVQVPVEECPAYHTAINRMK